MARRALTDEQKAAKQARNRLWKQANRDRLAAQARDRYAANPEKYRERAAKWRKDNPEKIAASAKKWVAEHKEQRREITRAWWSKNPGKKSEYARKSAYGLKPGQYAEMVRAQDGRCAICLLKRELVVDHDHSTGKIRGLLCQCCNRAIGLIKESPARLRSAARYLERHGAQSPEHETLPLFAGNSK